MTEFYHWCETVTQHSMHVYSFGSVHLRVPSNYRFDEFSSARLLSEGDFHPLVQTAPLMTIKGKVIIAHFVVLTQQQTSSLTVFRDKNLENITTRRLYCRFMAIRDTLYFQVRQRAFRKGTQRVERNYRGNLSSTPRKRTSYVRLQVLYIV